jgi:peptidyl-prolyl cis-trans isomerase SurA
MDIRKRALNGEDFGELAVQNSQDPSAKDNRGDLGYFSSFRMVYAFESAAFKTPKGKISNPVRTVLVTTSSKSMMKGLIAAKSLLAHIMILNPKEDKPEEKAAAEAKSVRFTKNPTR